MSIIMTNSQNYTNIADAIRAKNGQSSLYKPSEMAQAILNLPSGEIPGDPKLFDIFNHGSIVGRNQFVYPSGVYKNGHESASSMTMNNTVWTKTHYGDYDKDRANGTVLITTPYYNMDFNTLCIECEVVPYSSSGFYNNYSLSYIGFMEHTAVFPDISTTSTTQAVVTVKPFTVKSGYLTYYDEQTGTVVVDTFSRSVVRLNVPKNTPKYYWPGFYNINSIMRVYSVWLE